MTQEPKPLNKAEVWIADRAVPIFVALAVLILCATAAVFYVYQRQGDTAKEVHVLEPQVTKINQAICDRASLANDLKAKRCADRIRIGLVNCRHVERCRAALLAAITFPPPTKTSQGPSRQAPSSSAEGGDALQPSHHGHQPHGPGSQPGPSIPSPPPPAAPGASGEAPGHTGENPGQGGAEPPGQSGANHGQASGVGAEVCVLERCVGLEAGL